MQIIQQAPRTACSANRSHRLLKVSAQGAERNGVKAFAEAKSLGAGVQDDARERFFGQILGKPFQSLEIIKGSLARFDFYA